MKIGKREACAVLILKNRFISCRQRRQTLKPRWRFFGGTHRRQLKAVNEVVDILTSPGLPVYLRRSLLLRQPALVLRGLPPPSRTPESVESQPSGGGKPQNLTLETIGEASFSANRAASRRGGHPRRLDASRLSRNKPQLSIS